MSKIVFVGRGEVVTLLLRRKEKTISCVSNKYLAQSLFLLSTLLAQRLLLLQQRQGIERYFVNLYFVVGHLAKRHDVNRRIESPKDL